MARAQQMPEAARRRAGDPLAFARGGGGAAVEALGDLQRDQRTAAGALRQKKPSFNCAACVCQAHWSRRQFRPRAGAQSLAPSRADRGLRSPPTTRATPACNQRLGAGRRLAVMGAGLERDIGGGAARGLAGLRQRHGLGMGAAAIMGPAAADNAALRARRARSRPPDWAPRGQARARPARAHGACGGDRQGLGTWSRSGFEPCLTRFAAQSPQQCPTETPKPPAQAAAASIEFVVI